MQSEIGQRQTIAQLLRVPYRALVRELYSRLAAEGFPELQPAHSSIFPYIRDGVERSSDLVAKAQLTKQSVSYLVDSLEKAGLVERLPDPRDGRAKVVRLTEKGQAAERAAARIINEIETGWAEIVGPSEARLLRLTLERLCAKLEADDER